MGLPEETGRLLVEELSRAAGGGGMVGGQLLDLLGEDRTLTAAELDDLHRRKTGALLRASLRMGGMAAGASPRTLEGLDRYGAAVGLARLTPSATARRAGALRTSAILPGISPVPALR